MAMRFRDMMEKFDTFIRVERNLSPRTRAAYHYDLKRFADWIERLLGGECAADRVTVHHIKDYLAMLQEDHRYRPTTLSRVIATLRVFFEFGVRQGLLESSPAQTLHNPKLPRRLPIYLVESELQRLLSAPNPDDASALRDYAILITLGFTGVRLQELVGLSLSDLDFEMKTIKVMGKGAKERLIPLNDSVISALREYLLSRASTSDPAVFLNKYGRRLTGRAVEYIVNKFVRCAGITKAKVSPHKLRHTFATLLHCNEVDLVEIQSLMGHASITSTQIYTHTNTNKLRSAVGRLDSIAAAAAPSRGAQPIWPAGLPEPSAE